MRGGPAKSIRTNTYTPPGCSPEMNDSLRPARRRIGIRAGASKVPLVEIPS
jgi:hypothetical protein